MNPPIGMNHHTNAFSVLFVDFMCLHQLPRGTLEERLFRSALASMHALYGLQLRVSEGACEYAEDDCWHVCRLLDVPGDAENPVPYLDRGWCTFESIVSSAAGRNVIDILDGKMKVRYNRRYKADPVPTPPEQFEELIERKQFNSRSADKADVARLYRQAWQEHLSLAELLEFQNWQDEQVTAFLPLIPAFARLQEVCLVNSSLGTTAQVLLEQSCIQHEIKLTHASAHWVDRVGLAYIRN